MDTSPENPARTTGEHSVFRDLRARNERRQAMKQLHAERKQRIERVLEAARTHARRAKIHARRPHTNSD